jgi:hypothetical protein
VTIDDHDNFCFRGFDRPMLGRGARLSKGNGSEVPAGVRLRTLMLLFETSGLGAPSRE